MASPQFACPLPAAERRPYTLAIHRGGVNGEKPHAHLMFLERSHDGIERSAEQSFKYYNRQEPAEAGDALRRTGDDDTDSMIWIR